MPNNAPAHPTGDQLLARGDFVGAEAAFRATVKADPKNISALINLGVVLDRLGSKNDAIGYFRQASEIAKSGSDDRALALRNWALVLVAIGEPEQAENPLREALKAKPDESETLNLLGSVLVLQKQYEDAEHVFNKVIGDRSDSAKVVSALRGWGNSLNDREKFEDAANKFDEALKIASVENATKAWLHNGRGVALAGQRRLKDATKEFELANSLLEKETAERRLVLYNWASACIQDERFEKACECYKDAIDLLPPGDAAIGHFNYGYALWRFGRADDALNEYDTAIKIDPTYPYPYNNKADVLFQLGRYKEGWQAWNQAYKLFRAGRPLLEDKFENSAPIGRTVPKGEAVDRAVYFANALRDVFIEYKAAQEWYELALKKSPGSLAALCGRAILFRRWSHGNHTNVEVQMRAGESSREACEQLKDFLDRPSRFDYQRVLADIYIEDRDWSRLRDVLGDAERECGEMRGRQADILILRGILALGTDKPHDARRYFDQALIYRAGDLNSQTFLGLALMSAKQYDSALAVFRRVIGLAPGHIEALIGSALASIELADDGDADYYERAERYLTDALNHGYEHEAGSRRLDKDESAVANIYYLRGYAKSKRYDADRGKFAVIVVVSALHDFRQALRADPEHSLARSAIAKLTQHMSRRFGRSFSEAVGQFMVFLASLSIFVFAQLDFFLHNESLRSTFGLPNKSLLGAGPYAGVAFGALAMMIASLSLPKLLTLKVPGVELKKAATDQVGATLGVGRFGVFTNFVSSSLKGLNATPPQTSSSRLDSDRA